MKKTVKKAVKKPKSTNQKSEVYSTGSLLGNYPPGFEDGGKRLLAECPEFKLWELYHEGGPTQLETDERILRAMRKALFRIKGNLDGSWGKEEEILRVNRATALHYLVRFKELGCSEGCLPTATRMAESFVPLIEEALNSNDPQRGAENAGKSFRDAVLSLARNAGKIKDGRAKFSVKAEALLIWHAQGHFQCWRERPRKSLLRERLESLGQAITGKDSAKRWEKRFENASLENLPD